MLDQVLLNPTETKTLSEKCLLFHKNVTNKISLKSCLNVCNDYNTVKKIWKIEKIETRKFKNEKHSKNQKHAQ